MLAKVNKCGGAARRDKTHRLAETLARMNGRVTPESPLRRRAAMIYGLLHGPLLEVFLGSQ